MYSMVTMVFPGGKEGSPLVLDEADALEAELAQLEIKNAQMRERLVEPLAELLGFGFGLRVRQINSPRYRVLLRSMARDDLGLEPEPEAVTPRPSKKSSETTIWKRAKDKLHRRT